MENNKVISARIPIELYNEINSICKQRNIRLSTFIIDSLSKRKNLVDKEKYDRLYEAALIYAENSDKYWGASNIAVYNVKQIHNGNLHPEDRYVTHHKNK